MGGPRKHRGIGRSMIPAPVLAAWRTRAPWRDDRQVAQDLLLSLLAIRVAAHPHLAARLVWRGGTCLHKLHLEHPLRYSEDLDYVLVGEAPHASIRDALGEVVTGLGMQCERDEISGTRVNVWGGVEVPAVNASVRVKLEVNCTDASPVLDLVRVRHGVDTRVWREEAEILTFQPPELVGTKFRALAQRRKGRDLSDLWIARKQLLIADRDLALAGDHYLQHADVSPAQLRERLANHLRDHDFGSDLEALVVSPYEGFDVAGAMRELIQWTDKHLDPLHNARRNPNAIRREQQRWEEEGGWAVGKVRCPEYALKKGNLSRCPHWYEVGDSCPVHREGSGPHITD